MKTQIINLIIIFWRAARRLIEEQYTYRASALAFTTLLAIIPLLSSIVSLLTFFPIFTETLDLVRKYVLANFIPTSSDKINQYLETFTLQATHLPKLSILFLFFSAVMLIITVKHTLNDVWAKEKIHPHPSSEKHKKIIDWILYWVVLILMPFFIAISVFLSGYLFSLPWFDTLVSNLSLKTFLLAIIPLLINTIVFSTLYIVVPNYRMQWYGGILGGFVAALLFELGKNAFAFYLSSFPSYELIYGALALIPIFLVWLYISWSIILYGALVTHTFYQFHKKIS